LAAEVAAETGSVQLLPGLAKLAARAFFIIYVLKETLYYASLFFFRPYLYGRKVII